MRPLLRNFVAGLASVSALLLVACGGGGGGDDDSTPTVTLPTAVATASASSINIGTLVTLDGSASKTPNSGTLSYQWELASKPDGSAAALSSSTDAKPTLTPDVAGDYEVTLTVKDSVATSAAVKVTIVGTTTIPTAIVSPASQSVLKGVTVTLDGSSSVPPTGVAASALSYQWTLTQRPDGDTGTTLSDATSTKATFLATTIGVYKATLVVSHGDKSSEPVETTISVNNGNSSPVAAAKILIDGKEVTSRTLSNGSISVSGAITRGQAVTLDASASSDPDAGDTLHYRWTIPTAIANSTAQPAPYGSKYYGRPDIKIDNYDKAVATFIPDSAGRYYIDLTVYDGSVSTTQRIILLSVTKPEGAANARPVAVAGNLQFASLGTTECELSASSCSINGTRSYDLDGDTLTYKWTYWNLNTPSDVKTATGSSLNFGTTAIRDGGQSLVDSAGDYQFQLIVNDGTTDSEPVTTTLHVKTGANVAPIAVVSVPVKTALVAETIEFDGSGSYDRDSGGNIETFTYQWTLIDRPDGSQAVLQNASSAKATVVADKPGIYTALLQLTDTRGAVSLVANAGYATASVFAKAQNNAPVMVSASIEDYSDAVAPGQALITGTYDLNPGGTMVDPDNDSLEFLITVTKQPDGSTKLEDLSGTPSTFDDAGNVDGLLHISSANTRWKNITTVPGNYEFQFIAGDGVDNSAAKTVTLPFATVDNYPSLMLRSVITSSDTIYGINTLFPYANDGGYSHSEGFTAGAEFGYALTASDQDYTITNLKVTTATGRKTPTLTGLSNGQVIPKGQTVKFTFVAPAGTDGTLSFGVAEREGYTFSLRRYSY